MTDSSLLAVAGREGKLREVETSARRDGEVVVGKVGTSDDQTSCRPNPSSAPVKRKRVSDDSEEGPSVTDEVGEEPGSSLEPPSSKRKYIRRVQRAHVTGSSNSQTPDTQNLSVDSSSKKVWS